MAPNRIPGPDDLTRKPVALTDGTLPRTAMPLPGTVFAQTSTATPITINTTSSLTWLAASPRSSATDTGAKKDPEIEALDLAETAKNAAYALKKEHPSVRFTSGRRDKNDQARAMAENVVLNRDWIESTYSQSVASDACQKWVDDNPGKKTKDEVSAGLKGILDGLTENQLAQLSRHLGGEAFDVLPVRKNAEEIKKTLRALTHQAKKNGHKHAKFLEREGGLVRWHAQF
jgi:hypothetical protein